MPIRYTCSCGKAFNLADNLAGKTVRCPTCQTVGTVPPPLSATTDVPFPSPLQPLQPSFPTLTSNMPPVAPPPPRPTTSTPQAGFPLASTPMLDLPNPYGSSGPLALPQQPAPPSAWNQPSMFPQSGLPAQASMPKAYQKPPGLSRTASIIIGIGILMVTSLVVCCGVGVYVLSMFGGDPAVPIADLPNGMPGRAFALPPPILPVSVEDYAAEFKEDKALLGEILAAEASDFKDDENWPMAIRHEYTAIELGAGSRFDLARHYRHSGQVDIAYMWLESALEHEGMTYEDLDADADFIFMRFSNPTKWNQLLERQKRWERHYQANPVRTEVLIVPEGYQVGTPIPIIIGMHGYGHHPQGFSILDWNQDFANSKQVAFLNVSGTDCIGPKCFKWSPHQSADKARIDQALQAVSDRVTPAEGRLVTFGFSQGALAGARLAVHNPEKYAGGIILSPGGLDGDERVLALIASPANKTQGFVFLVNGGEHEGNIKETKDAEQVVRTYFGARTLLRIKEGEDDHTFPSDFFDLFESWLDFTLSGRPAQ